MGTGVQGKRGSRKPKNLRAVGSRRHCRTRGRGRKVTRPGQPGGGASSAPEGAKPGPDLGSDGPDIRPPTRPQSQDFKGCEEGHSALEGTEERQTFVVRLTLATMESQLLRETRALDAAAKAEPTFLVPRSSAECPARCATEARYVSRTPALLHVPEHYINSFNHGLLLSKDYLVIIG